MKKWRPNWRLVALATMLLFVLSGCGKPFLSALQPAGEVADTQYTLMLLSTTIMVIVIAVVTIIFIYVLVRFRQRKGDENRIPKQVEGSHKLEIIWTVIPILLLIILAVPTVSATFKLADISPMDNKKDKKTVIVNVTAKQYWWEFEYPKQGVITSQDLVVPTDERVYFNLKANDVKHSFWIPAAGGKMDTNTDNVNKFYLTFDGKRTKEAGGIFYGKCAELCGPSHALMDFKVKPLPRNEFDAWMKKMQNEAKVATNDSVQQGEELFKNNCLSCHAVSSKDNRPEAARVAPNLATFGDRERIAGILPHDKENLVKWLRDPQKYKPGNKMPGFNQLSDQEMDALAEYLMNLKVE